MAIGSIKTGQFSLNNERDLQKSLRRLSSGSRLDSPGADPAGQAVLANIAFEQVSASQGTRNMGDLTSMIEIQDGAVGQIQNILTEMAGLAEQAANGTISDQQRQAIDQQYQAYQSEIVRIQESTTFNGQQVLTSSSTTGQAGPDTITITGADMSSVTSGAGSLLSTDGARAALDLIATRSQQVASIAGELGAGAARVSSAATLLENQNVQLSAASGRIGDADIASESANKVSAEIRQKTELAANAHKMDQQRTFYQALLS